MGFYNVLQGDAPYLKYLADNYAMSDNFHQAVKGGTGANHVMLGTGDAIWFSDGRGHADVPRTINWSQQAAQMLASWTKSKIQILSPGPTTGTRKMAMAPARSVQLPQAAGPTASAPIAPRPASANSFATCTLCRLRSIPTALAVTTIS